MKKNKTKLNFKDWTFVVFFICSTFYFARNVLIYYPILSFLKTEKIDAIVIDDDRYIIPNQRVFSKKNRNYYFSYMFKLDGKEYFGNTGRLDLKVYDTFQIEYNGIFPFINKPAPQSVLIKN